MTPAGRGPGRGGGPVRGVGDGGRPRLQRQRLLQHADRVPSAPGGRGRGHGRRGRRAGAHAAALGQGGQPFESFTFGIEKHIEFSKVSRNFSQD